MPNVTFQNSGQSGQTGDDGSIRELSQKEGWPIPYGCENGICGTCLITIPTGKENLSPIEEQEAQTLEAMGMDEGEHRLACQCKAKGDVTIAQ
jgi:ferredoxin